jgi:hypothetical protein
MAGMSETTALAIKRDMHWIAKAPVCATCNHRAKTGDGLIVCHAWNRLGSGSLGYFPTSDDASCAAWEARDTKGGS